MTDDPPLRSYHLARLASHSGANKMTLSNLRLILSPTLRLSPIFLQILVEEREILFGKLNECESCSTRSLASSLTLEIIFSCTAPRIGR